MTSNILQIGISAKTNIGFTLIPAKGIISGNIGSLGSIGNSPYFIYVPSSVNGYMVYYHLSSDSAEGYEATGYYSETGTTTDVYSYSPVFLYSDITSGIDLMLLPTAGNNMTIVQSLTSSSIKVYLVSDLNGELYAAVFDSKGKMLAIGSETIFNGASSYNIDLYPFTVPEQYVVKLIMLDADNYIPLNDNYIFS